MSNLCFLFLFDQLSFYLSIFSITPTNLSLFVSPTFSCFPNFLFYFTKFLPFGLLTNFLFCLTNFLFCFTNFLFCFTNFLFCFTNFLYCFTNLLFSLTNLPFCFTNFLFCFTFNFLFLFCETDRITTRGQAPWMHGSRSFGSIGGTLLFWLVPFTDI